MCAVIFLSLSAVLAGCSEADFEAVLSPPPGEESDGKEISMPIWGEDTDEKEGTPGRSGWGEGEEPTQSAEAGNREGEEIPRNGVESVSLAELPRFVFQTGDGHLLLLGDRVELMNIHTFETERCLEDTGLDFSFRDFDSCRFAAGDDDYLVVGNYLRMEKEGDSHFMTSSEEPRLILVRFSRSLEILEVLNLGEAMELARGIDEYALDSRGTRLLCASLEGCFLYDLEKRERISYPMAEEKLFAVSSLGYMESEDRVLFTAFYDDGSRDYQHVFGSMNLDGANLQYEKKQTQEWGEEIWCFRNFALIEDGELYESGEKGKVFYCGADGKVREYILADEYTSVQPSETGKYFAVQSREWAEDGRSTGYTVRVYESESGRLIQTIDCPFSEAGEDTMLCQCIVSEERKSVLLLFCDRETEGKPRFQVVKWAE